MIDEFQIIRDIIEEKITVSVANEFEGDSHRRLYQVLSSKMDGEKFGKADLIGLIRQILREEEERQCSEVSQSIRVPLSGQWPEIQDWEEAGFDVFDEQNGWLTLKVDIWSPAWLPYAQTYPPEKPVFAFEKRREFSQVLGDPFLKQMGINSYLSKGQCEAVRAVMTAPAGSTLVVTLPTGSGKSLCFQIPALWHSQDNGVTIVIVPTVALCIDQERAMSEWIDFPTAYYSDSTEEGKLRNEGIRQRIRDGSQRIVFTSPESFMTCLSSSIYIAARQGLLKMLVIDEAHMVDLWGDEFRPAFQEIAGVRNFLLRDNNEKAFSTILLSATLTESSLITLKQLFGQPGPFRLIASTQLRPEPSYWISHCINDELKAERVMEAIYHLPRPLIIYTSKVSDAKVWGDKLRKKGFLRLKVFTGDTTSEERVQIIHAWKRGEIDIVVATSAFGMGVDYSGVRTVIHACVPENPDRLYQEVGRSGRDGRASLSLMIYTDDDINIANNLNTKKIISVERGLERWKSMFHTKDTVDSERFRVYLDVSPSFEEDDIDMKGDYNTAWNARTLTLMNRAGLIKMDAETPSWLVNEGDITEGESYRDSRIIRLIRDDHLNINVWNEIVEPIRRQIYNVSHRNFEYLQELLGGIRCISEIFAEVYHVKNESGNIHISKSCGGCPACREKNSKPKVGELPLPLPVWNYQLNIGSELQRFLGDGKRLAIFYDPGNREEYRQIKKVTRWFIAQGIVNVVCTPEKDTDFIETLNVISNYFLFLFNEYQPVKMPKLPTLIYRTSGQDVKKEIELTGSSIQLLILPMDIVDPFKPHCWLRDTINCKSYLLDEFLTEVGL